MDTHKALFKTEITLRVSDINYGGHLGNDRFLSLAQDARARWLHSLGGSEKEVEVDGVGIVVTSAHIKFLREAFLGQTIQIHLTLLKVTKCTMDLAYQFIEKESQKDVGYVETTLAFFDYQKRKVAKTPEKFQALIAS